MGCTNATIGNGWCGCGLNTCRVCGEFETPTNPDKGRCFPHRVKLSCERPDVPAPSCPNDQAIPVFNPTLVPPYRVQSILMDENCDPITDEHGDAILVISV